MTVRDFLMLIPQLYKTWSFFVILHHAQHFLPTRMCPCLVLKLCVASSRISSSVICCTSFVMGFASCSLLPPRLGIRDLILLIVCQFSVVSLFLPTASSSATLLCDLGNNPRYYIRESSMSVHCAHAWCSWSPAECVRSLWNGVNTVVNRRVGAEDKIRNCGRTASALSCGAPPLVCFQPHRVVMTKAIALYILVFDKTF